eukprot:2769162-Rhodomonas_salina.4
MAQQARRSQTFLSLASLQPRHTLGQYRTQRRGCVGGYCTVSKVSTGYGVGGVWAGPGTGCGSGLGPLHWRSLAGHPPRPMRIASDALGQYA